MPGIFIYSEDDAVARQLLSAGIALKDAMNAPIWVVTAGAGNEEFIARGADVVVALKAPTARPEAFANVIADLVAEESSSLLLVGATLRGKEVAARVAARLNAGLSSDAQSVKFADGSVETSRLLYCGLAVSEEILTLPAVVTIAPRSFPEPEPRERKGEVKTLEVKVDTRIAIDKVCPLEREGVDISAASKIISVGRGFTRKSRSAPGAGPRQGAEGRGRLHEGRRRGLPLASDRTLHRNFRTESQAGYLPWGRRVGAGPARGWHA